MKNSLTFYRKFLGFLYERVNHTVYSNAQGIEGAIQTLHEERDRPEKDFFIQRTNPDSLEFTLSFRHQTGTESKDQHYEIIRLDADENLLLREAYALLQESFDPEELDPLERIQESIKGLRYGCKTFSEAIYFIAKNEKGEVASVLGGAILPIGTTKADPSKDAVFMVSYVGTKESLRRYGFGREIMITAYQQAKNEAQKRGLHLIAAAGECTWASQKYWNRLGWKRVYIDRGRGILEEIPYVQPPLAFDIRTGVVAPGAGPVPEHFMMHSFDGSSITFDRLMGIVKAFYQNNNHIHSTVFLKKSAYERHRQAIVRHEKSLETFVKTGKLYLLSADECLASNKKIYSWCTCDQEKTVLEKNFIPPEDIL